MKVRSSEETQMQVAFDTFVHENCNAIVDAFFVTGLAAEALLAKELSHFFPGEWPLEGEDITYPVLIEKEKQCQS